MRKTEKIVSLLIPVISILIAFLIGALIIAGLGKNPAAAYGKLLEGAFGSMQKFSQTLEIACPLIFTGLCASFAYKCGVFNLGGEGQFIMGAVTSIAVSLTWGLKGPGGVFVSLLCGTLAGAVWGAIPGVMKVTRGLNEMITSIMLNYVATLFMGYIFTNILREGVTPQTPAVDDSLKLADLPGMKVHWGFLLAVLLAVFLTYVIYKTSFGFQIRAVGMNPIAARFNGFRVKKLLLLSFIISGAIGGLGGSIELHGKQFRLMNGFGQGFGFDGVAIALIAQLNPIGAALVAFLFAVLRKGSSSMQTALKIPSAVASIIQALIIIFAVGGSALIRQPGFRKFLNRMHENREAGKEASV